MNSGNKSGDNWLRDERVQFSDPGVGTGSSPQPVSTMPKTHAATASPNAGPKLSNQSAVTPPSHGPAAKPRPNKIVATP